MYHHVKRVSPAGRHFNSHCNAVGWIIVRNLLKQFAYRIEMSMFVFAGIAFGAIVIAMLTVSFQAYKASGVNPAEALKIE